MAGLRQLNQGAGFAVVVIEPEIFAEDLLVPVGAVGADDDGIAVGRNLERGEADGVEEFVEGEFGFVLGYGDNGESRDDRRDANGFLDSHRVPWEEGLYNGGFVERKFAGWGYGMAPQYPEQRGEGRHGKLDVSPA